MRYIDIHAHLNFSDYDKDRAAVITRTLEAGVGVINIGTDKKTSEEVLKLAEENDKMWAAIGVHPHEALGRSQTAETGTEFDYDYFRSLAKHPKVVAIGECGLDYYQNPKSEALNPKQIQNLREKQQELFKQQIKLAKEAGKPLMLHIRESYDDVLAILESEKAGRAHAHFFAGSLKMAQKFLDRGDTISVTGVITFTNTYDEVIKSTPLDRLMAETDAPFVAPAPYRGRRNEPSYVVEVVKKIAELKGLPEEEVRVAMLKTVRQVFGPLWLES